jgi:hypothetical protein
MENNADKMQIGMSRRGQKYERSAIRFDREGALGREARLSLLRPREGQERPPCCERRAACEAADSQRGSVSPNPVKTGLRELASWKTKTLVDASTEANIKKEATSRGLW